MGPPGDAQTAYVWTDEELNGILREWQRVLGLLDWDVKIRWAASYEMPNDVKAAIIQVWQKKAAVIKVLRREDYDRDIPWDQDIEQSIVHELLHISFHPFEPRDEDTLEWATWHQELDQIALALVTVKREV